MAKRWEAKGEIDIVLTDELEGIREVVVRIVSGDVSVTAAEGVPRVEVQWLHGAEVEATFSEGVLRITQSSEQTSIVDRVIGAIRTGMNHKASVALNVPPGTKVNLATVSAPIVVHGIAADTRVKSVSGDVTLDGLSERVDVKNVSGDVAARAISADLTVKTVSGSVSLVNGTSRLAKVKSVSGDVTLDLDPDPSGVYDVNTVSGYVALRTGGEPNLVVEAKSLSGEVSSDFGLRWDEDKPGRRSLRERLGDGGARLVVKTVSGDLRLVRRRDVA